ncbi:MAG: DUF3179 domain-containing (seleno)protein [Woeseiaceae bacterium]|nr:DUF3179 domain-containing (seleno)protein [Woeseiaceae bacterium]
MIYRNRSAHFVMTPIHPELSASSFYLKIQALMGLEIDGRFKAYPFKEFKNGAHSFDDEFSGKKCVVKFDEKNRTAQIVEADGAEIPSTMAFWFAWYAFHPATDIYEAQ